MVLTIKLVLEVEIIMKRTIQNITFNHKRRKSQKLLMQAKRGEEQVGMLPATPNGFNIFRDEDIELSTKGKKKLSKKELLLMENG